MLPGTLDECVFMKDLCTCENVATPGTCLCMEEPAEELAEDLTELLLVFGDLLAVDTLGDLPALFKLGDLPGLGDLVTPEVFGDLLRLPELLLGREMCVFGLACFCVTPG